MASGDGPENLLHRCRTDLGNPVSYDMVGDSPSPYCSCIMDGFEVPDADADADLIFSNINMPEKIVCGDLDTQIQFGNTGVTEECVDGNIPDLSNLGKVELLRGGPLRLDNNISDTYLQSTTNLYNNKLNEDTEIVSAYVRCKEEKYRPIINKLSETMDIITTNKDDIQRILNSNEIENALNSIGELDIHEANNTITQVNTILNAVPASDIKSAVQKIGSLDTDQINKLIDTASSVPSSEIKDTIDNVSWVLYFAVGILIVFVLIIVGLIFYNTVFKSSGSNPELGKIIL
jgi:hypothetical protein